jgi:hypothetical protein
MTEHEHERNEDLVAERGHLLPEEEVVGSDDPLSQAEVILQESLERTDDPEGTRTDSQQTLGDGREP